LKIEEEITFGSLFSGGGGLDMGLERAGLKCTFQVENDKHCITLLNRHWPDVPKNEIRPCMGLVGGDPCPIRSKLGILTGSSFPDMSGYFLAMAGRIKPRWVLRENVPSPDVRDFTAALAALGYGVVVIKMDSKAFTGQMRRRDFVVGFRNKQHTKRFEALARRKSIQEDNPQYCQGRKAVRCLTKRGRGGLNIFANFVYEGSDRGLRSLSHTERESLQGWPIGWTDGLPHSARERITGNGVTAPVATYLGRLIIKVLKNIVVGP